jgi:hypothetical protein
VEPARPLTHDLIRDLIAALGHSLKEVRIVDLQEGTFYADLVFDQDITVSARPSDSVAIALRMGVPIYVEEAVLAEAGLLIPTSPTKRHQARSARTRSRSSRNFSTPSRPTISRPPDPAGCRRECYGTVSTGHPAFDTPGTCRAEPEIGRYWEARSWGGALPATGRERMLLNTRRGIWGGRAATAGAAGP